MKTNLLKAFLALALLCEGESAWGDDVYTTVFQRNVSYGDANIWTSADATEWGLDLSVPTTNEETGVGIYKDASSFTSTKKTFTITASNAKIKYEASWTIPTRTYLGASGVYLSLGNKLILTAQSQWNNQSTIYANTDGNASGFSNALNATTLPGGTYSIEVIFNSVSRKAEKLVFNNVDYTSTISDVVFPEGTEFNSITLGHIKGSQGYNKINALTTLKVSQMAQVSSETTYTINYKDGDNIVKAVNGNGNTGETIVADLAVDGTEGGYVGVHYLTIANIAPTMSLVSDAASNVLNVPVRLPYTGTLKLTTTIGSNSNIQNIPLTETDEKVCSWDYSYSKYVKSGDNYYIADDISSFSKSGTFTNGQTIEKEISYSNIEDNIVLFSEFDNANYTNIDASCSNGSSKAYNTSTSFSTELDKGCYDVIIKVVGWRGKSGYRGQSILVDGVLKYDSEGKSNDEHHFPITISDDNTVLTIRKGYNETDWMDYVLIKKLPANTSITVPTGKEYATFNSDYALDFTGVTAITAYTAVVKSDGKSVTMTKVTGAVPANTGLLIRNAEKNGASTNVPVVASASAVTNEFIAVTAANCDAGKDYKTVNTGYVLGTSAGVQGFYKANTSGTHVGKGKAYLPATGTGARLSMVFDDEETTGISLTPALSEGEGAVYNLNGQRVNASHKGIVIKNGKKLFVK